MDAVRRLHSLYGVINVTEAPAEEVILLQGVNRDMSLFSNRLILRSHMSLSNGPGCWDEQTPFSGSRFG